jgi:cystinosin
LNFNFLFKRGEQRVSTIARGILGIFFSILIVTALLSFYGRIHWLDFLNACSFIKLAITLIKYIPQAILNYRRKSTVGWSIGNILMDFTGGVLSMLQMILNSYNYSMKVLNFFGLKFKRENFKFSDDWQSLFGDPTKFGLGLFSALFDVLFIIQHYVLYRFGFFLPINTPC